MPSPRPWTLRRITSPTPKPRLRQPDPASGGHAVRSFPGVHRRSARHAGGQFPGSIRRTVRPPAEHAAGQAQQNVTSYTSLQSLFDISGNSGIPYALNNLFSSFSAWGESPTSADAQQAVINSATDLASAFQQTASGMTQAAQNNDSQIGQTVTQINQLVDNWLLTMRRPCAMPRPIPA